MAPSLAGPPQEKDGRFPEDAGHNRDQPESAPEPSDKADADSIPHILARGVQESSSDNRLPRADRKQRSAP